MPRRNPSVADWNLFYAADNTPWDMGRAHPELVARLADDPTLGHGSIGDAVVPGCGAGHDVLVLADEGWAVTAIDFADIAVDLAPPSRFVNADILDWDEPADLWFDHTLFCAISPDDRERWGEAANRVVRPGGTLVSLVYPACKTLDQGPPWPMSTEDVAAALGPDFEVAVDEKARDAGRPWESRWAVFRKAR